VKSFFRTTPPKEGVITTASGLQYKVITEGTGKSPKRPTPCCALRRHLDNGNEFDSSYKRKERLSFAERVIPDGPKACNS